MLTCPQVRDALVESPRGGTAAVVAHLKRCAACRALAAEWRAVDAAAKAHPTPTSALRARDAFLARFSPITPRPKAARRVRWLEWTVAASVFLGVGAATFFLAEPRALAAKSKLVEEVAEWHLAVSEADTPDDRERLVRERLPALRQAVRSADLPAGDRQLANKLIEGGEWLVANRNPLDEAERLHGFAEAMLTLADEAEPTSERSEAFVKLTAKAAKQAAAKAARQAAAKEKQDEARLARLLEAQERQAAKMAAVAARQVAAHEKQAKAKKGKKK